MSSKFGKCPLDSCCPGGDTEHTVVTGTSPIVSTLVSTGPDTYDISLKDAIFTNEILQWDETASEWKIQSDLTSDSSIQLCDGAIAGKDGIAIGKDSNSGGTVGISIGKNSGNANKGQGSVSVGFDTGILNQGVLSVAVGPRAGMTDQGAEAVAVGYVAGQMNQGERSVALGHFAGQTNMGADSIALGYQAGQNNQPNNSFFIGPTCIRDEPTVNPADPKNLEYDTTTGEIYWADPPGNVLPVGTCDGEYLVNNAGSWELMGSDRIRLGCSGQDLATPVNTIAIGSNDKLAPTTFGTGQISMSADDSIRLDVTPEKILIQTRPQFPPFNGTPAQPQDPIVPINSIAFLSNNVAFLIDPKTWVGPSILAAKTSGTGNFYTRETIYEYLKQELALNNIEGKFSPNQITAPDSSTNVYLLSLPGFVFTSSGTFWNISGDTITYVYPDTMVVRLQLSLNVGRQDAQSIRAAIGFETSFATTFNEVECALPRWRVPAEVGDTACPYIEYSATLNTGDTIKPYIRSAFTNQINVKLNIVSGVISIR